MSAALHLPVMKDEMLAAMRPQDGETYLDATFGAGGYSRALLESAECRVFAIDRDPNVQMLAEALARDFPGRFLFLCGQFSEMVSLLAAQGVEQVNGIAFDLGTSSMQLDQAERGFSFREDGPLDMRMACTGLSAAEIVNEWEESALADVVYRYGEERASRRIARAIVRARAEQPITRTAQLAEIIRTALGAKTGKKDPATRSFQALRIAVNNELEEIEHGLIHAASLLAPHGRLVVVTFHSLEDRIVKHYFRRVTGREQRTFSRHLPASFAANDNRTASAFQQPSPGRYFPTEAEIASNPRARSAILRVIERGQR